jgi:hypothetical protein
MLIVPSIPDPQNYDWKDYQKINHDQRIQNFEKYWTILTHLLLGILKKLFTYEWTQAKYVENNSLCRDEDDLFLMVKVFMPDGSL